MARQKGKFYWTYKGFASRNFDNLIQAKRDLKKAIKKNPNILGRNRVYFVKHALSDVEVGYYGASGKWWMLAHSEDLRRWKRTKTKNHPLGDPVWEPKSRTPSWAYY